MQLFLEVFLLILNIIDQVFDVHGHIVKCEDKNDVDYFDDWWYCLSEEDIREIIRCEVEEGVEQELRSLEMDWQQFRALRRSKENNGCKKKALK